MTGLSGRSGGLARRQIHRYAALFVFICSPRAATAAMASMQSLSQASLVGHVTVRGLEDCFGEATGLIPPHRWDKRLSRFICRASLDRTTSGINKQLPDHTASTASAEHRGTIIGFCRLSHYARSLGFFRNTRDRDARYFGGALRHSERREAESRWGTLSPSAFL